MERTDFGWPPKWFCETYARANTRKRVQKEMEQLIDKHRQNIFFMDDPSGISICIKDSKRMKKVDIWLTLEHYPFAEPKVCITPDYKAHRLVEWSAQDSVVEYVDTLVHAVFEAWQNKDFLRGNQSYENTVWVIFWPKK